MNDPYLKSVLANTPKPELGIRLSLTSKYK